MELDHAVLWVKDAKQSLNFYVDVFSLTPVRAQEFADGKARFPSVRLNEGTIFDIMEMSQLLPLVQNFTGGGDGIGGMPINNLCMSMGAAEYEAVLDRLKDRGVTLKSGGENVFGARGQAGPLNIFQLSRRERSRSPLLRIKPSETCVSGESRNPVTEYKIHNERLSCHIVSDYLHHDLFSPSWMTSVPAAHAPAPKRSTRRSRTGVPVGRHHARLPPNGDRDSAR